MKKSLETSATWEQLVFIRTTTPISENSIFHTLLSQSHPTYNASFYQSFVKFDAGYNGSIKW